MAIDLLSPLQFLGLPDSFVAELFVSLDGAFVVAMWIDAHGPGNQIIDAQYEQMA